jgi:hypothetical protein
VAFYCSVTCKICFRFFACYSVLDSDAVWVNMKIVLSNEVTVHGSLKMQRLEYKKRMN